MQHTTKCCVNACHVFHVIAKNAFDNDRFEKRLYVEHCLTHSGDVCTIEVFTIFDLHDYWNPFHHAHCTCILWDCFSNCDAFTSGRVLANVLNKCVHGSYQRSLKKSSVWLFQRSSLFPEDVASTSSMLASSNHSVYIVFDVCWLIGLAVQFLLLLCLNHTAFSFHRHVYRIVLVCL